MFVSQSTTVLNDWWILDKPHTHLCILFCLTVALQTLLELFKLTHVLLHVLLSINAYEGIAEALG